MADTDWTNEELASIDRIPRYNILDPANGGDAYSFGGDGYLDNQMRQTVDALIVARGARRMALSASSAAVLAAQEAASAKAERMAAQNAATNAYSSAQDAAAKVALAAAEADRAKAQADLAKGYATGLKLPAVTPDMAGRFLKVNADGTAYELGLITIATAAEINAGTGTGLANAATLGPILKGISDPLPPVGSFLMRAYWSPDPGPNWLPADGQLVPLSSYPALADVLPPIEDQYLREYPLERSSLISFSVSGSGTGNTPLRGVVYRGYKSVTLQTDSVRFMDYSTGVSLLGALTGEFTTLLTYRPVVMRQNDAIFLCQNGYNSHVSTDAATIGACSYSNIVFYNNESRSMVELPNGAVLIIGPSQSDPNLFQVARLRPGATSKQWSLFNLPVGNIASNYFVFKDKTGRVYIVCRNWNNTGNYSIFRTADGETWTTIATALVNASGGINPDDDEMVDEVAKNVGVNLRKIFISNDGSKILYFVNDNAQTFYVSVNGGDTFSERTIASIGFAFAPTASGLNVDYDKFRDRFVFVAHRLEAANNTNYPRIAMRATNDFSTYTTLCNALGRPSGSTTYNSLGFVIGKYSAYVFVTNAYYFLPLGANGELPGGADYSGYGGAAANFGPVFNFEKYPFDGTVMIIQNAGQYSILWDGKDYKGNPLFVGPTTITSRNGSNPYRYPWISPDRKLASIFTPVNLFRVGAIFSYNPAVERRVPKITHNTTTTPVTISETYQLGTTTPFKHYMRAK